jgi:hemoglobin-like flavoprotein
VNGTITESLEAVAEKCGDPTPLVYARVFERYPEYERLFVLDSDDGAKGQMLSQVIECVLDFDGEQHYAANFIASEMINHDNLGVDRDVFASFLDIVKETFEAVLGDDWTEEYERAWANLIADLKKEVRALA